VQDTLEIAEDSMVEDNGYFGEATTAAGIPFSLVSTRVQFEGGPSLPKGAPPYNGQDRDAPGSALGLDEAPIRTQGQRNRRIASVGPW
jgi:hypothetical protein